MEPGAALVPAGRCGGEGKLERVSGGSEGPGIEGPVPGADHRGWKPCSPPSAPGDLPPPAHSEMHRPQAEKWGGEAEKGSTRILHG